MGGRADNPGMKRTDTQPRRIPRSPLGAATVDAILTAVEQILERDGVERLTTNHVAELAGVSIGSLYQYFPNKQSLLGALQDRYAEDTFARVRAALHGAQTESIRAVIARVGAALLATRQDQRPIHRWLIDSRTAAGGWERYRHSVDQHVELIAEFLETRSDVEFAEPRLAAFVIVHAMEGLVEAVSERPSVDAAGIVLNAIELVVRFLEKRSDLGSES
jgi:AcrR family transcriptional regulator